MRDEEWNDLRSRIGRMASRSTFRRWRRRIGAVVSALIVVAVALALSRPAITASSNSEVGVSDAVQKSAKDEGGASVGEATPADADAPRDTVPSNGGQVPHEPTPVPEPQGQLVTPKEDTADERGNAPDVPAAQSSSERASQDNEPTDKSEDEAQALSEQNGVLAAKQGGIEVKVAYDADAGIAEGTSLAVRPVDVEGEEHAACFARAIEALGISDEAAAAYEARFFDITLTRDGDEVEPQASVRVSVSGEDVPVARSNAEAKVVHFAAQGTEVLDARATSTLGDEGATTTTYAFEQGSFSVTGLLVKKPDVPSAAPNGAQLAKKRELSEIENGGTYIIYTVSGMTLYAIGVDGCLHEMRRTSDGKNIYMVEGGTIDQSLVWTFEGRVVRDDGLRTHITNVADPTKTLYPRTDGTLPVESGGNARALIRTAGNSSQFNVCDNGGKLSIRVPSTADGAATTVGGSPKTLYIAEVPTVANYTATQVTSGPLLEGYYVISRGNAVQAGAQNVIVLDHMAPNGRLAYTRTAEGVGRNQLGGFLNSCIWYVRPNDDGTYVMRNLWSGENLYSKVGSTSGTVLITSVSGNAFNIETGEKTSGLRAYDDFSFAQWDKASNFFFYRIDGDGFYHAYFDMNMGGNSFYRYTSNGFASHVQYSLDETAADGTACHTLTLPTAEEVGTTDTASLAKPYHYRLNGWVDIYGHAWYPPGAEVVVTNNAVFYPDWVAESYSMGRAQDLSSKAVFMPAITTSVFDYNELMNVFGLTQLSNPTDDISSTGHSDRWKDSLADDSFLFIFNDGQNRSSMHNVNANTRSPWNSSHSNGMADDTGKADGNYNGVVTPGILGQNPSLQSKFFDPETWALGKTYVGTDHNLYSYDYDTGYYYYDSNRNAASYNQADGRFYVYNYTNRTNKSHMANADTWKDDTDFLPLNYGQGEFAETGEVNYWFGMKTEFYFFLPNDATTDGTKNKSIKNEDMAFRFSGDDDVWVLVDDQLVLDLGGVHGTVYGEINFSTSQVTCGQHGARAVYELKDGGVAQLATQEAKNAVANDRVKSIGVVDNGGTTYQDAPVDRVSSSLNDTLANLKAGNHKLTFLYLERGSSESNAAIYFNIAPVYQVDLTKVDGTNGGHTPLTGATFKVYTDAACTQEAAYVSGRKGTTYDPQRGFVDTNGSYYFDGFVANQEYYLKEIETPEGYRTLSGPIKVLINGSTNTCTYMPTDDKGNRREEIVCTAELQPQGTVFSGVYGGFQIEVPNYTGREIPAAGGMGTAPYVVAGASLAGIALVGLVLRRRRGNALCVVLMALALCVGALAARPAMAQEAGGQGTLTVTFEAEGMPFSLYRVGNIGHVRSGTDLEVIEPFVAYAAEWPGTQSPPDYDGLAARLAAGAVADGTAPVGSGSVKGGTYSFGEVADGWYLLTGASTEYEGYVWSAVPTLVRMPTIADGGERRQVSVHPKWSRVPLERKGDEIEHRLVKQWANDDASLRPRELHVALVHGDEVVRTVVLNPQNNWSYVWTCADDGKGWTAVEQDVPQGYAADVSVDGARITVRNTRKAAGAASVATGAGSPVARTADDGGLQPIAVSLAVGGAVVLVVGLLTRRFGHMCSRVALICGVLSIAVSMGLLAQGVRAQALERSAQEQALNDLVQLIPQKTSNHVDEGLADPLSILAVDGRDLVGYVDCEGARCRLAVHTVADGRGTCLLEGDPRTGVGVIDTQGLEIGQLRVGDALSFVDVDGRSYGYVVDAVAREGESVSGGLVLKVSGMTEDVQLVCAPATAHIT